MVLWANGVQSNDRDEIASKAKYNLVLYMQNDIHKEAKFEASRLCRPCGTLRNSDYYFRY